MLLSQWIRHALVDIHRPDELEVALGLLSDEEVSVDFFAEFARGLYLELLPIAKWALRSWALIATAILFLIYWRRKQRNRRRPL